MNTCLQISNSLPALGQLVTQCAIISGGWGWGVGWGRDYCLLFPRQPWARFTTSNIWTLEMKEHKIKWKIENRTCGTKAENLNYVFPAQMPIATLSDRLDCTLLHCIFSAFVYTIARICRPKVTLMIHVIRIPILQTCVQQTCVQSLYYFCTHAVLFLALYYP